MPDHDIIVIGGGSAGIACARTAAGLGADVLLAEPGELGGTCVNRGCVPKKLLWATADTVRRTRAMLGSGALTGSVAVDLARHRELRDDHIAGLRRSYAETLAQAGVTVCRDRALVVGPGRVRIGETEHAAPHVVLATGGRPATIPIPGAALVDTSDDVLRWTDLPATLLVVGGGYIGCEFAAMFAALGVRVTLVTDTDRVLVEFSDASARVAQRNLEGQGIDIRTATKPERFERHGDGDGSGLSVRLDDGTEARFARVLLATGRDADLDAMGDLAVARTDGGTVATDDDYATSVPGLFAIGDVSDRLPLTPVATADGVALAHRLTGHGDAPAARRVDLGCVATAAFVMPTIAEVGDLSGAQGETFAPLVGAVSEDGASAAWHLGLPNGRLAGVSLVGESAQEAIGWAAQTILHRPHREGMGRALAVHPTDAEEAL